MLSEGTAGGHICHATSCGCCCAAYLVQRDGSAQLLAFSLTTGNLLLQRQHLLTGMGNLQLILCQLQHPQPGINSNDQDQGKNFWIWYLNKWITARHCDVNHAMQTIGQMLQAAAIAHLQNIGLSCLGHEVFGHACIAHHLTRERKISSLQNASRPAGF